MITTAEDCETNANKKPQPSWMEWANRNSEPKRRYWPRPPMEHTIWQKKGPMKRKDWRRFIAWAVENAAHRDLREIIKRTQERNEKHEEYIRKRDKEMGKKVPKIKKNKPPKFDIMEILETVARLARPKYYTPKVNLEEEEDWPFSPKIHWNKPAHKDPGRPFVPFQIPCCFVHDEVEHDFWSKIRFPVRQAALNYKVSSNIKKLAKPRKYPQPIHICCFPPPPIYEYVEPRKRMSYNRWQEHKRRLQYLAKPVQRPYYQEN